MRIFDNRFKYTPSMSTNIVSTWKRHGFKPTTEAERQARQRRAWGETGGAPAGASVTRLDAKRKRNTGLGLAGRKSAAGAVD